MTYHAPTAERALAEILRAHNAGDKRIDVPATLEAFAVHAERDGTDDELATFCRSLKAPTQRGERPAVRFRSIDVARG